MCKFIIRHSFIYFVSQRNLNSEHCIFILQPCPFKMGRNREVKLNYYTHKIKLSRNIVKHAPNLQTRPNFQAPFVAGVVGAGVGVGAEQGHQLCPGEAALQSLPLPPQRCIAVVELVERCASATLAAALAVAVAGGYTTGSVRRWTGRRVPGHGAQDPRRRRSSSSALFSEHQPH
jgi:hypothetical protein